MDKYTINTPYGEIFNDPQFLGWRHMVDFRRGTVDDVLDRMTPAEYQAKSPVWDARRIVDGFLYLDQCLTNQQVFYHFWNEAERQRDPAKELTGLAAFTLARKSKFVVICPGGAYGAVCTMLEGYPLAKELNELGYAAFVVNYRVGRDAKQVNPMEDLSKAIWHILHHAEEFNLDIEGYGVMGFSAGAHLAGCFGLPELGYQKYELPKPGMLILGYPVITMTEKTNLATRRNLLGEEHQFDPELIEKYSIEKHVTAEYPPTFVWQCDGDDAVPVENSALLAGRLRERGVRFEYELFHHNTHGLRFDVGEHERLWVRRAVYFWENAL